MPKIQHLMESKDKTVGELKKSLGGTRKVFDTYAAALAAFNNLVTLVEVKDADGNVTGTSIPCHAMPEENFEPTTVERLIGGETFQIAVQPRAVVAMMSIRQKAAGSVEADTGIKAILLFAMPDDNAFVQAESGWVSKLIEKECAHVGFRNLRSVDTTEELANEFERMPYNLEGYTADQRAGVDTEAFDAVWPDVKTALQASNATLVKKLPRTPEFIKALRSKSYALANPATAGFETGGNLFKTLGEIIIVNGQKNGIDMTVVQEWLDTRDTNDSIKFEAIATADEVSKLAGLLGNIQQDKPTDPEA